MAVCLPAVVTVEVIRVIGIVLEQKRLVFDDGMTLLADVFSQSAGFLLVVTGTTQVPDGGEERELDYKLCLL